MKNYSLKRYFVGALSALVLIACVLSPAKAYASSGLAVSAGKDFGDGVDTRQDAIDASAAYADAGYSTVTFQTPTKSDFTSENLKADILFLSGHGNADVLSFGTFKFVCQSGTANSNYTNLWNTAKNQKLITFAGCNTAGGDSKNGGSGASTDSITKRVVDQGAEAAIGWTTTVSAGSHTNWLKRYNNALADGKSVSQAINAANSYIYLPGSGVKNVKYFGNGDLTITSSRSASKTPSNAMTSLDLESNNIVLQEIVDLALMNRESFDMPDYCGYIYAAHDGYFIDVYYKSNGVITNAAVTLHIDFDGEIKEIMAQNILTDSLEDMPMILAEESITPANTSFKTSVAMKEQTHIRSTEYVSSQTQFEYYDVAEKITYLVTYTEIIDDVGAKYVAEDITPIR